MKPDAELPVIRAGYEFVAWLIPKIGKFPRDVGVGVYPRRRRAGGAGSERRDDGRIAKVASRLRDRFESASSKKTTVFPDGHMHNCFPMIRSTILSCLVILPSLALAEDAPATLAEQGYGVLQKYCFHCHADDFKYPGLDMRDRVTLLRPKNNDEDPFIVPGNPGESRIWDEVDGGRMPPDDQPQLTAEDKALLQQWIEAGAEFPLAERPQRPFIGERTLLALIAADLRSQSETKHPNLRYFSLAHLWNSDRSDEDLRIVRAAVSKLINSLSSQPRVVVPTSVDRDGVVLRIDLKDYGWDTSRQWLNLLNAYPFGLQIGGDDAEWVYGRTQCDLPYLRADWFVYAASRPPLYHALVTLPGSIGIPEEQSDLERLLGVDLQQNFQDDRLWRAGFSGEKSGVSDHNRIVERHDSKYGYYWPSYDSAKDIDRANFFLFPLGPKFPGAPNTGVFEHDGGEIIFSLPNKLQAYMLAKANGERIDVGPQQIVKDPNSFSGSYDIVNGISCMGCHRHGIVRFEDTIRSQFVGRAGAVADKVRRLYPEQAVMDEHVKADRKLFLDALEVAVGPFLRSGANDTRDITDLVEPVTAAAKTYDRPLRLVDVARELGLPESQADAQANGIKATAGELASVIKFSEALRRLELTPLSVGEPITRVQWERSFGRTARELGIGIPLDFIE